MGTPVLLVDTEQAEADLEAIPWVEDARVRTSFPNTVSIEIRERTPLVAMAGQDGLSRVLGPGRQGAGLDRGPTRRGSCGSAARARSTRRSAVPHRSAISSAVSLVTKLTPTIRSRVDSMMVTPDGSDLVLVLTGVDGNGPIEVRFGSAIGDNEQIEKLVRLERKLEDVGADPVSVIDVSTAEVTVL